MNNFKEVLTPEVNDFIATKKANLIWQMERVTAYLFHSVTSQATPWSIATQQQKKISKIILFLTCF